jgi:hypothetical protein
VGAGFFVQKKTTRFGVALFASAIPEVEKMEAAGIDSFHLLLI